MSPQVRIDMATADGGLPTLWSSERPALYHLVVALVRSSDGSVIDAESCQVAFYPGRGRLPAGNKNMLTTGCLADCINQLEDLLAYRPAILAIGPEKYPYQMYKCASASPRCDAHMAAAVAPSGCRHTRELRIELWSVYVRRSASGTRKSHDGSC